MEDVLRVLLPLPRRRCDGRRNCAEPSPLGELRRERHARRVHHDSHERSPRQGNADVEGAAVAGADGGSLAVHQRSQLGTTRSGPPAHGVGCQSVISTITAADETQRGRPEARSPSFASCPRCRALREQLHESRVRPALAKPRIEPPSPSRAREEECQHQDEEHHVKALLS